MRHSLRVVLASAFFLAALSPGLAALDSITFDVAPGVDLYGGMGRVDGAGTATLTTINVAPEHYLRNVDLVADPTVLWRPPIKGLECDPNKFRQWSFTAVPRHTNADMLTFFAGEVPRCHGGGGSGGSSELPTFDAAVAHVDIDADNLNDNIGVFQRRTNRSVEEDQRESTVDGFPVERVKVLQNAGYEESGGLMDLSFETTALQDYQIIGIKTSDPDLVQVNLTVRDRSGHSGELHIVYGDHIKLYDTGGNHITSGSSMGISPGEYTYLMEGLQRGQGSIEVTYTPDSGINKCVDSIAYDVKQVVKISYTTYIPFEFVNVPRIGPNVFEGDDRGTTPHPTSYRTRHSILVIADSDLSTTGFRAGSPFVDTGITRAYADDSVDDGTIKNDQPVAVEKQTTENLSVTAEPGGNSVTVFVRGSAANPLVPESPAIDYAVNITVTDTNGSLTYTVEGAHDQFPGHEIYADEQPLHLFEPSSPDDVQKLFGPPAFPQMNVFKSGSLENNNTGEQQQPPLPPKT